MKKEKQAKKRVSAQTKRPGKKVLDFVHVLDEVAILFESYNQILKDEAIKEKELLQAVKLFNFLQHQSIQSKWIQTFESFEFYRIVPPGRNPLSFLGSFSCGGRLNLGTPQTIKEFDSNLSASFGLYGSIELATAREEYDSSGLPSISSDYYKISYKKPSIKLFDFDLVIDFLSPIFHEFSLATVVSEVPYNAAWKYQKWPKVSQIIGSWLRGHSSKQDIDGILFRSTKKKDGNNVFLFFNDELDDAMSKLSLDPGALNALSEIKHSAKDHY